MREFEERYGASEAPPVPVERIASSYLDLDIDEHDDIRSLPGAPQDQGRLSGMIDPANLTIWVDRGEARRNPRRRRFTIAHEIGHWRMHIPQTGEPMYDAVDDIREEASAIEESRNVEAEADLFARELLMPEELVREHVRDTGCDIAALVGRFDVSPSAMRLRVMTLGLMPKWMRST